MVVAGSSPFLSALGGARIALLRTGRTTCRKSFAALVRMRAKVVFCKSTCYFKLLTKPACFHSPTHPPDWSSLSSPHHTAPSWPAVALSRRCSVRSAVPSIPIRLDFPVQSRFSASSLEMSQPGHAVQLPAIILESSVFLPHNTMRLDLHAPIARALLDRWTDQSASSGSHVAVFSSIPSTITFPSGSVTRLRSGARVFNTGCVAEIVSASSLASSAGRSAEKDRLLTILLKGLKRCTLVREESALSVKSDAEGDTPSSSVPVMTVQPFALEADGSSVSDLEGRLRKTALLLFVANPHLRSTQLLRAVNQSNTPIEQIGDILMQSLEDKEFFVDKLQALACARLTVYIRTVLEVATKVTATISAAGPSHQQGLSKSALSVKKETFGGSAAEEDDVQELREKWTKKSLPAAVDGVIGKELKRMTKMPSLSPEYSVIRTYIETLLDFPWNQLATSSNLDLTFAQQVLDREHFGLQDIKKRVLQYIAVMILLRKAQEQKEKQEELSEEKEKGELKDKGKKELPRHASRAPSTILCLVGPPGVGKTSLGQSIAKVLQRPFQRIALGGVFDEAELRGHRRTYIGSLPGNIIQAVKRSGVMNPVILLDEVDKAGVLGRGGGRSGSGGGGGGDGAIHAALLEILDPDQNHSFLDHYLAVPVDLSQVVFIATANSLDPLPGPLRDRMEVIHVSGYTVSEKMQIARRHLVSREIASSGLSTSNLCIADDAMEEIVVNYTREAGVRQLRREIATICRHGKGKPLHACVSRLAWPRLRHFHFR